MWKYGIALALSFVAQAWGAASPFEQSLRLLDRGDVHAAYLSLESIPTSDPEFVEALIELQKLHYRRQDWHKFFAYAQFYRLKTLANNETLLIQARMISLEVMALAKHCRWKEAQEVLTWAQQEQARLGDKDRNELNEVRDYLQLLHQFPNAAQAQEDQVKLPGAFSQKQAWKLQAKALSAISHPKLLSVKLTSECKE